MEEASLDQGFDRLPFFFALFCVLTAIFSLPIAEATTFGPINVTEQIRRSQYFIHGRIVGASWVEMERRLQRPFTHWRLQVLAQPAGNTVGPEITIREPGGEIGGFGYHVAGSAKFSEGEEVFVTVRDTEENNVKELVGLTSGKYSVVPGADGKAQVRSALGFPVRDPSGKNMSPKEFENFAARVAQGKESENERNIWLNKEAVHDHDTVLEQRTKEAIALKNKGARTAPTTAQGGAHEATQELNSVQNSPENTEEPRTGFGIWWLAAGVVVAILVLLILRKL
jgi:hypothetical protein